MALISGIVIVLILSSTSSANETSDGVKQIRTIKSLNSERYSQDIPEFISRFLPISDNIENQECRKHSLQILDGFRNFETWALKMVDASAKLQSGILFGNIKNYGQYDECLGATSENFAGQYCLATIQVETTSSSPHHTEANRIIDFATLGRRHKEMTLHSKNNKTRKPIPDILPSLALAQIGVCVPSSCTSRDVQTSLVQGLQKLARPLGLSVTVEIPYGACAVHKTQPLSPAEITVLAIFLTFGLAVAASSTYYILRPDAASSTSPVKRAIFAFALPLNWNRLFSTDHLPTNSFGSLEGIRVLSTFWVVMTHKMIAYSQEPWLNKAQLIECLPQLPKMPLINTMLNVDTFLLVSGLLKAYHFLQDLENKRFNFFSCYSRRYLRLTPAYAMMIAFYATLLSRFGRGPASYKTVAEPASVCRENWFYNLLYVNNYVGNDKQCMIQSWYLAADMQLCLLSPIIIYPLWRWPNIGKTLLTGAMGLAIIIPFCLIYFGGELATFVIGASDENLISYLQNMYFTTHTRMAPYVVGIGLGYLFYKLNTIKLKLSKITMASGWALCIAVLYAVIFGAYDIVQMDHEYIPIEQALYGAFHRPAWAIAVSWIIFACHTGYGGYINDLLCARVFQPLSRLSYCIFLTHYIVLMIGTGRIRTALFVDEYTLLHDFLGDLILIILFSIVLYLFVEAPLFEITKIIYRRGGKSAAASKNKVLPAIPQITQDVEAVTPSKVESEETLDKSVNGQN